jgi:hypothetical protein
MQNTCYQDSAILKLAAEINEFVRSKTDDEVTGSIALATAHLAFSLRTVETPGEDFVDPIASKPGPSELQPA